MPHNVSLDGAQFDAEKTKGLYEPGPGFESLGRVSAGSSKNNRRVTDAVPYFQQWREEAHRIKEYAVANLDKLLVEFERRVTAKGVKVLFAATVAEANRHILDIARRHQVRSVVKSKSMVTEELELNHVLAAEGIRPVETDLGEYIVQLAEQRPIHIVTPAIHMSAADVGRLFAEKLGEPYQRRAPEPYRHRPPPPPPGISASRHGHLGLQLRRGRHRHGGDRGERGQRRAIDGHAAGARGAGGN